MKHIRNFCIIAHIDHGKSTIADRLLERTDTIQITEGQMLDDMDLEKERGITIKSHAIQMDYLYDGEKEELQSKTPYVLNLIDTPGHVDFAYEVSRSIAACEGCLLVVDSTQGVQAQTISNLYMAIDHDLEIIPVINKCDMPNAMPEEVEDEIVDLIGCKHEDIIRASGKTGMGVEEILQVMVDGHIEVGDGLRLNPLRGIHHKERALTGSDAATYLVAEIHVSRCVDEVQDIFLALVCIFHLDGVALDGDSTFLLQVHVIQHLAFGDTYGLGKFQEAVGQSGFTVVNMGYDTEIAYMVLHDSNFAQSYEKKS